MQSSRHRYSLDARTHTTSMVWRKWFRHKGAHNGEREIDGIARSSTSPFSNLYSSAIVHHHRPPHLWGGTAYTHTTPTTLFTTSLGWQHHINIHPGVHSAYPQHTVHSSHSQHQVILPRHPPILPSIQRHTHPAFFLLSCSISSHPAVVSSQSSVQPSSMHRA